MSTPIRFADHSAFHHQVLRVTLAGAALGLATYVAGLVAPLGGEVAQAILLSVTATALGLAAFPPTRSQAVSAVLLGLGVGLVGALALQLLTAGSPSYPWFGLAVYGLSVGIVAGRDLKGSRRLLLPLATAVTVVLGSWVAGTFRAHIALDSVVPALVAETLHGALYGFLVSIALVTRQVGWQRDSVGRAFGSIRPTLGGEMLDIADQALTIYSRVQEVLRDRQQQGNRTEPDLGRSVERLVLQIFEMGRQWQEVERGAGQTSADELARRIEGLEAKIAASGDELACKQYCSARDALAAQLRYLIDISRNRERVMARAHNYLATLERLHLALWNHRGADAAKLADEVQPILDDISDRGHEMDFASAAMDEVASAAEASDPELALAVRGTDGSHAAA